MDPSRPRNTVGEAAARFCATKGENQMTPMKFREATATALVTVLGILAWPAASVGQGTNSEPSENVAQLEWMAGSWTTVMGSSKIEEHWTRAAGGSLLGTNRTIRGGKMRAFEFLRIVTRTDGIYYIAQPNGRPGTEFKLTRIADGVVVFENPGHDFPRWIRYQRISSSAMRAEVKGITRKGPRTLTFEFSRVEPDPQP